MKIDCDVLIIGGGMAGIRAAIEASDCGADVVLVSKKKHGFGGASFYTGSLPWGVLTAGHEDNAQEKYYNEIIAVSCGAINKGLVQILAEQSNERFNDLLSYGIEFTTLASTNRVPCFGEKPRGAQLNSMSNLRESLNRQLKKRPITVVDTVSVLELIVKDGTCFGAIGQSSSEGTVIFTAKAVVLATGGAESLWKHNLVTPDVSGDGYAMALRNGAGLCNMEFIQFIPGTVNTGALLNFHSSSLRSMPLVRNGRGEEFLTKYLPEGETVEECFNLRATHGPFSNEDASRFFDISMEKEKQAGSGEGVNIVYGEEYYKGDFKLWKELLSSKGIDTKKTDIKIYPHCQGFNGGIVIDEGCRTEIECLFACGECTGGAHGANRMGGNAILDTQVFGKIAGENAAKQSKSKNAVPEFDYDLILKSAFDSGNKNAIKPDKVLTTVKEILNENALIVRTKTKLEKALSEIADIEKSYNAYKHIKDGKEVDMAVRAGNALLVSKAVVHAMLERKESRGAHYREDYPVRDALCNEMNRIEISDINGG